MPHARWGRGGLAIVGATLLAGLVVTVPGASGTAQQATTPATNPPIADSCGVDVTLVLDASGSINSSHAVETVRNAAKAFLEALKDTSSNARVTQFGTVSAQLAPSTLVDGTSLGPGGALTNAVTGYYNPIPPRPSNVNFRRYNNVGDPLAAGSFTLDNGNPPNDHTNNQYTNWDQALDQAGAGTPSELVVFVTDGDPTAYDFVQPPDPYAAPDVAFNTSGGLAGATTLDKAVVEANQIKTASTRMLAVGVGAALNNPASEARLAAVSGPQVVRSFAGITSLNQVDVALVTNFNDLAAFLRAVVLQLCSPSLTIRKLAQSPSDSTYQPTAGWSMTATPTVPGGTLNWILPDTTPATSKTLLTDANGFAQFQWEPQPANLTSQASVLEEVQAGFTPGRPGPNNDFRCELKNQAGAVRVMEGELTVIPPAPPNGPRASFALPVGTQANIGEEIVTCSVWNSFDYDPEIAITKTNAPPALRGDLTPPATVTSNYAVTNPGNTPLSTIVVVDDKCAPVTQVVNAGFNVGDTNRNRKLDLPETWQFTCARNVTTSRRGVPTPTSTNIVNTAAAFGTDPSGTTVTASDTDDVDVFFPKIALTKLVNGEPLVVVPVGSPVTYTYAVTNTGDTPLGTVTLVDDTPPCQSPTPAATNTPPPLLPGQTWNYQCGPVITTTTVINTATVTGIPLNPLASNQPFPAPNPVVTATDNAEVDVVSPGIDLTKSADPTVVVIGPDGLAAPVTYTYEATNTGDTPLNRPGAFEPGGPGPTDPGWIVDDTCSPVTYVTGDDGNDLLDPDETWEFTCAGSVDEPTLNTAEITGQPSAPDGAPLPVPPVVGEDFAFVDVVTPDIEVVKTALRGVVLDPGAEPIAGPDVPTPRPAEYLYEVTNTGNVSLDLDPDPPTDNICSPLVFVPVSDGNADGLLDPDETWIYLCETELDRDDANTPPDPGDLSGLVTNTVTAIGVPVFDGIEYPDKSVTATDTAQVLVIEPSIRITKLASAQVVLVDGDVTYTFVVANTGDVGLDVIGPGDDRCAPLVFIGGDLNGNGILDGADSGFQERWIYQCTRALGLPTPPETTDVNTAAVAGIDPLGNLYVAADTAEVRVFDPDIALVKTVSDDLVPAGTEVTYGFDVTNTGQSPLASDDVLANIVLADAVEPPAPAQPSCAAPTFTGGDTNGDNLLTREPPEVWTYQCSAVVSQPTTDVARVQGTGGTLFTPPLPVDVFDADAAFVQTFTPGISVTKSASPTQLVGSGQVTYTYLVRNTGDVPLSGVASRITDNTCSPVTYVSGDTDIDGLLDTPNSIFEDSLDETWTFTCTRTVTTTTTNTVVVTGTPSNPDGEPLCGAAPVGFATVQQLAPCDTTGQGTATVTVNAPATITIVKRTPAPTTREFDFTYGTEAFKLKRDASATFANLAPGTYTVTETVPTGWQLERVECIDASGDTVVGLGARQVVIVLAAGETVTCTFHNRLSGVLPNTGNSDLAERLAFSSVLLGLGAALVAVTRRRAGMKAA